jgi:hypothetical protein
MSKDLVPAAEPPHHATKPIETITYELIRPDGTRLVGKSVVDKVVAYGRGYVRYYCSPSIEPDGSDPRDDATRRNT